jgi:CspA family cold shock protein
LKGVIKKWFPLRGYGFIDTDGEKKDIFIHSSDVSGVFDLNEGEKVEFDIEDGPKGIRAVNVKLIQ